MNNTKIKSIFTEITFRKVIWLAPLAYFIHQIEETIYNFPSWRYRYTGLSNPLPIPIFFTILMCLSLVYIIFHYKWTNQATALVLLTPQIASQFHNGLYHLIGTIYFGVYSPGLITGLILYISLSCLMIFKAYQDNYINKITGFIIIIASGVLFWTFEFIGPIIIVIYQIIVILILIIYYRKLH